MEVKTFKNGNETIKTVKIGNTEFRVDNFRFKTKKEFVDFYKGRDNFKFNRDDAWDILKQFVKPVK